MNARRRLLLLTVVLLAFGGFLAFDLGRFFTLDYFQSQRAQLTALLAHNPLQIGAAYFLIYVLVTALSIPGAAVMTLIGGALFGLLWGTLLVSFASTAGATLAFVVSRSLLREGIQSRYGERLRGINAGFARDGGFYLFTLRLIPVVPFFLVNLLMGMTPIRARTFYWVSQLGMFPATLVYVNAGTELGQLTSLRGVLSPGLLGAFVLLGLFPYLARALVNALRARQSSSRTSTARANSASRPACREWTSPR